MNKIFIKKKEEKIRQLLVKKLIIILPIVVHRVKQEQNELEKKMSRIQSEGQDNPGFEM